MKKNNNKKQQLPSYRINGEINYNGDVRVIGNDIESTIMPMGKARHLAKEMEKDIIQFNMNANPPIMKIASYEKMMYELKKSQKKPKQSQVKEIQLTVNIASNDMATKAKKATEFIEDGDKVKVVLRMKGRELSRRDESKRSIYEFVTMLEDVAVPESMPKDEGNRTIVILKKKNSK